MKKIGVLGGGISGLSTAYYLLRQNPKLSVYLFEGKEIGGWIQTSTSEGFITEKGPRSFRISERATPLLRICEDIGLSTNLLYSTTTRDDAEIFDGEKLVKLLPPGSFKFLKLFLFNPVYRRFILSNLATGRGLIQAPDDDLSIRELLEQAFKYQKPEDKDFFVDVIADAFVQGIYSGDISELSSRFCYPFSVLYDRYVTGFKKDEISQLAQEFTPVIDKILKQAKESRSSAMNFKGGMSTLPKTLLSFLQNYPGFEYFPEHADKVENLRDKVLVKTMSQSFELDHVISTVPSHVLASLVQESLPKLSEICLKVPHKSLKTLSLGFDSVSLKGVGFLIPSKFQSGISGALYDSCSFPYLAPSVSIMGSCDSSDEEMIQQFRRISKCEEPIKYKNASLCINGLPQYKKGHFNVIYEAETAQPPWLSVSGQSFYLSGIPNCVNRARELVLNNEKFL
jgi:oxygen-dependent protoporphyrinogen oxidase